MPASYQSIFEQLLIKTAPLMVEKVSPYMFYFGKERKDVIKHMRDILPVLASDISVAVKQMHIESTKAYEDLYSDSGVAMLTCMTVSKHASSELTADVYRIDFYKSHRKNKYLGCVLFSLKPSAEDGVYATMNIHAYDVHNVTDVPTTTHNCLANALLHAMLTYY